MWRLGKRSTSTGGYKIRSVLEMQSLWVDSDLLNQNPYLKIPSVIHEDIKL